MNISTLLEMAAESFPDRLAVICGEEELTYGQLLNAARAAALKVQSLGARNIAYLDISAPATPIALFGAAMAGVPYVPLNYRLTKPEIEALLDRVGSALLIADPAYLEGINLPSGMMLQSRSAFMQEMLAFEEEIEVITEQDPRLVAVNLFTSGTTGKPKAAVLRHENLMSYILGTVEFASAEEDEAIIVTVPPYHIAGISALLSSTYALRRMVQLPNFEAAEWLKQVRRYNVTNAFLVPTMLGRIVEYLDKTGSPADTPSLRAIAYGGGKMPLTTIARAMELFPDANFTNAYGLTETSSTVALLGPDDHRAAMASDDNDIRRRLTSVGKPLPTIELEIRNDDGVVLAPGQSGHVYIRGGQVSGEYEGHGSLLDDAGWFSTRDRGWQDMDGYLFLEGRADDVIVRGGENISPGEIEDVLLAHSAVADVAVAAIPDEQWGEGVGAAIVLHAQAQVTAQELQDWVKARLRSSRVPQHIEFRSELPYNETGKVLRRLIRQDFTMLNN